jgi:hypothetical protein
MIMKILSLLFSFWLLPSLAQAAEDFYKGKTIRVLVGGTAGGGFDVYTRAMTRFMGKHIPGNPSLYVENMTGAATRIVAKYIHSAAKPDGLTFGIFNGYLILGQVLDPKALDFNVREYEWIGVPVQDNVVCALRKESGIANIDQWRAVKTPVKIGAGTGQQYQRRATVGPCHTESSDPIGRGIQRHGGRSPRRRLRRAPRRLLGLGVHTGDVAKSLGDGRSYSDAASHCEKNPRSIECTDGSRNREERRSTPAHPRRRHPAQRGDPRVRHDAEDAARPRAILRNGFANSRIRGFLASTKGQLDVNPLTGEEVRPWSTMFN